MKERLLKLIRENGFLLFLFICVCFVGASTIYVVTREVDKPEDNKEFVILEDEDSDELNLSDESDSEEEVEDVAASKDEEEVLETIKEENLVEEEAEEVVLAETNDKKEIEEDEELEFIDSNEEKLDQTSQSFIKPVEGEVITVFATDTLIYSKTLDEWRSHPGIDIKADVGTKVKAIKDGVVKKVVEDDLWGITIIIDHGDGMESKYANLGTKEMVQEGIQVKQGDIIGTVGETAKIEMLMDSHLHFEVTKDGKLVDPRSILD